MIGLNAASIGGIVGAESGSLALNHYANKEQKDSPRYHKLKAMSAGLGATSATIAAYQLGIRGKGPKVWAGRAAAGLAGIGAGASIYHGVKFNKARATQIAKEKSASMLSMGGTIKNGWNNSSKLEKATAALGTTAVGAGAVGLARGGILNEKKDDFNYTRGPNTWEKVGIGAGIGAAGTYLAGMHNKGKFKGVIDAARRTKVMPW